MRPGFKLSRDSMLRQVTAETRCLESRKGGVWNSCHPLEPDPAFPKTVTDMEAPQCHAWKVWGWWNSARCLERERLQM